MLSQEFISAVETGNFLRVRIMLKDSLVVDPSFAQFNEMLARARQDMPGLIVPYDGESLEDLQSKWNEDLMNMELVEIVNNFSDVRIEHLKKVIRVVLVDRIKAVPANRSTPPSPQLQRVQQGPSSSPYQRTNGPQNSYAESERQKEDARKRKQALSQITNSSKKIANIMSAVQAKGDWKIKDIHDLEKAAKQILDAARDYRNK